jgi:transcriptional regulator with XRE-family HTH domain
LKILNKIKNKGRYYSMAASKKEMIIKKNALIATAEKLRNNQSELRDYKREMKERMNRLIKSEADDDKQKFARMIGETAETVSNWTKTHNSVPSAIKIKQICEKLGISADWMIKGEDENYGFYINAADLKFKFWYWLWESNQAFCVSKIEDLYLEAYMSDIMNKIENEQDSNATGVAAIEKRIKEWKRCLRLALNHSEKGGDIEKEIMEKVEGRFISSALDKIGGSFVQRISEEEKQNRIKILKSGYAYYLRMGELQGEIETLLELFEED